MNSSVLPTAYNVGEAETEMLNRMFCFHPPHSDQVARYTILRSHAYAMAAEICKYVPASRERQVALDRLSEAVMHANAGIARNEPKPTMQSEEEAS